MTADKFAVIISSFYYHSLYNGVEYSSGLYIVLLSDYFKAKEESIAWISALLLSTVGLFGLSAGILVPVLGFRLSAVIGSVLAFLGLALSSMAPSLYYLYVSFGILQAIGLGFVCVVSMVSVQHCFDDSSLKGLALGIATSGSGAGLFVLSPLIQSMASMYSWRMAMIATAGYSTIGILLGLFLRFEYKNGKAITNENENHNQDPESLSDLFEPKNQHGNKCSGTEDNSTNTSRIMILCNFRYLRVVSSTLLFQWGKNMTLAFLPSFAKEKGISSDNASWFLVVIGIFVVIGRIGATCLTDMKFFSAATWLVIYGLLGGMSVALLVVFSKFLHLLILVAVFGFCQGAKLTIPCLLLRDVVGFDHLPHAFGLMSLAQGLIALATPLGGWLKDHFSTHQITFIASSSMVFSSGLLMLSL